MLALASAATVVISVEAGPAEASPQITRVTNSTVDLLPFHVADDGSRVAYKIQGDPGLYSVDVTTGTTINFMAGIDMDRYEGGSIADDGGRYFMYTMREGTEGGPILSSIHVRDASGGTSSFGIGENPKMSRDGNRLAFWARPKDRGELLNCFIAPYNLYVASPSGSNPERILSDSCFTNGPDTTGLSKLLAMSGDGTVAFTTDREVLAGAPSDGSTLWTWDDGVFTPYDVDLGCPCQFMAMSGSGRYVVTLFGLEGKVTDLQGGPVAVNPWNMRSTNFGARSTAMREGRRLTDIATGVVTEIPRVQDLGSTVDPSSPFSTTDDGEVLVFTAEDSPGFPGDTNGARDIFLYRGDGAPPVTEPTASTIPPTSPTLPPTSPVTTGPTTSIPLPTVIPPTSAPVTAPPATSVAVFGVPTGLGADEFVTRIYRDILGRAPTTPERAFALAYTATRNRQDMIRVLLDQVPDRTTRAKVIRLYLAALGRGPDTAGLAYWTDAVVGGRSLSSVASTFAGSREFREEYGELSAEAFVDRVYRNVLGRAADPGGRDHWTAQLERGLATRGDVMLSFSEANEHARRRAGAVELVELTIGLLGRVPTAAELAGWAPPGARINFNEIVNAIMSGAEFAARA